LANRDSRSRQPHLAPGLIVSYTPANRAVSPPVPGQFGQQCGNSRPQLEDLDLEAGKVIEVDSSSGALHRLGQDLGVATPVHTFAYRALKYYASPHR
jgi:Ketopantoate reductase PanE/ApbA C terminal